MKLLIIGILLSSAVIGCKALSPSPDFSQIIADCKAMNDVTFIVEGRFQKSKKQLKRISQFDNIEADLDGLEPPPKPIYMLRADIVHLGSTGVSDNRTGKQMVKSLSYTIREGEAPEGLKGKGVICYKGSNPRTIKSIHVSP